MSTQTADTSVRSSIVVDAPIERAFSVFTDEISTWWPPTHHILPAELAGMVFEPREGGYVYDRGIDGSECQWGRVLAYEPPTRILFTWDISPRWQIETDPTRSSEVEIRFIAEAERRTRVELEHRHIERHGDGWQGLADGLRGDQGWPLYLERFAAAAR